MSNIAIKGAATGSGTFTLEAPATSTNRTLTLPDEAGTIDTLQRAGNVLQVVNVATGAVATGTTIIPGDDTIPQITEGDQYMSLAITPTSATSLIEVAVVVNFSRSAGSQNITALFRDAVPDALAVVSLGNATDFLNSQSLIFVMTSGTTSEITFRVRLGGAQTGTHTFNGQGGSRRFGGKSNSSITIKEYAA